MGQDPLQVIRAAVRPNPSARKPRLLIVGATGVLGNEVLRRVGGSVAFAGTLVLAREAIQSGVDKVQVDVVPAADPAQWPSLPADVAVVLFDPPRLFYQRERALWTPRPEQLLALGRWLRASGVGTLAVVLPHAPGRLPEALKRGLANLDEQALATLGFERLLILRSAQKPEAGSRRSVPARLAHWMLGVFKYMVPSSEQPVRAVKIAELLAAALRIAPPGIHVAAPETVWEAGQAGQAGQGDVEGVARRWLAQSPQSP